jgi:hypothetical protein
MRVPKTVTNLPPRTKMSVSLCKSGMTRSTAATSSTGKRDLLSSREEFIEKALDAYLDRHGRAGVPQDWRSTVALAKAEVEGRVEGAFHEGFVAELAQAARDELAKEAEKGRERSGNLRDRG